MIADWNCSLPKSQIRVVQASSLPQSQASRLHHVSNLVECESMMMTDRELQTSQHYRDASRENARRLIEKMDRNDPLWMDRIASSARQSWFDWSESFFASILPQTVCLAVIVCLLISATSTRITLKAATLTMAAGLQTTPTGGFDR